MGKLIKITESQLKRVMGVINENEENERIIEFSKKMLIKKLVDRIVNGNMEPSDDDIDGLTDPDIHLMYDFDDDDYHLTFTYETHYDSYPWYEPGSWNEPPSGENGEWTILRPGRLEVLSGDNEIYSGEDFTNFISLKLNDDDNTEVQQMIYDRSDERIQDKMEDAKNDY
jgi:hypothetical protein